MFVLPQMTAQVRTDVVHTAIGVGTSTMVFDATPHEARVEIDTQYTVLTRFSIRNSNFMLPALSRATHHAFQRHNGASFHRCHECEVIYLKMGAPRRDNLGARRRDSHCLLENGRTAARQPGRTAARQSWPGFAHDGRCAAHLNKCVINETIT